MDNSQKIEIAKHFVSLHKNDDITNWISPLKFEGDQAYIEVYDNLNSDVYGETYSDNEGELVLEIGSHESKSGNAIRFEFESEFEIYE